MHQVDTHENNNENIYSRPIELFQSQSKSNDSITNGASTNVMTSSCPPATLLRHYEADFNGTRATNGGLAIAERFPPMQNQNILREEEIYSNGNCGNSHIPASLLKYSDRPYSTMTNHSPPPRPPSLLRRNKPMNTSPHHHHYYHHQRDSGHASIGSSEDLSLAPPLPPRYSCNFD